VASPIALSDLAAALDWDGTRTREAVATLRETLGSIGFSLQEMPHGIAIRPAPNTRAEAAAVAIKARIAEDDPEVLELIWQVWSAQSDMAPLRELPDTQRELAGELLASRILDLDDVGHLRLSATLYRALAPALGQLVIGGY
jgi:hypothetical protein